jgi:serine protease Do
LLALVAGGQLRPANAGDAELQAVAERVVKSVVNIASTRIPTREESEEETPFQGDPFFEYFFGPHAFPHVPRDRRERSLGSGVIVSSDGVVLTNHHVVEGADEIRVTLPDGQEYDAKLVGADPHSDLAVLRVEKAKGLEVLPFGDSDKLRLAETVLAIGNPFGVGQTVTMGIVSATGRANVGIADYEDFIQTDAAINPGNSGGALVNSAGQLVGINTAIVSRSGGYQGVGFAIPSNMARPIMDALIADGRVVRGWLGVSIQNVDRDMAEALGIEQKGGVLVAGVSEDGPAAKADIKPGDVIVRFNDNAVDSTGQLRNLVAKTRVGSKVTLDILRDRKPRKVSLDLGELPEDAGAQAGSARESEALGGLEVAALSSRTRSAFEIPDDVKSGVVVTDVAEGSSAESEGIQPGDVVLQADRKPVESPAKFTEIFRAAGDRVLLLIWRGGDTLFVVLKKK